MENVMTFSYLYIRIWQKLLNTDATLLIHLYALSIFLCLKLPILTANQRLLNSFNLLFISSFSDLSPLLFGQLHGSATRILAQIQLALYYSCNASIELTCFVFEFVVFLLEDSLDAKEGDGDNDTENEND